MHESSPTKSKTTSSPVVDLGGAGRFAPSPTGFLHLGNLRTALAAYLLSKSAENSIYLRVDDLDGPRVRASAEASQRNDLALLGFVWDWELPRQSVRTTEYELVLNKLIDKDLCYPCFCSRKDIQQAASAPNAPSTPNTYPGTCANLDKETAHRRISAGEQHCYRMRVQDAPKRFKDEYLGELEIDLEFCGGDFVVRRADSFAAYQLACAVDDGSENVTEVLRGADLLQSAARQAWIIEAAELNRPQYFHIPLMLGSEGERLAKRDGSDDLASILQRGFTVPQVLGYLAWSLHLAEFGETPLLEELISRFNLESIPKEKFTHSWEKFADGWLKA